jgi:hypothetical protein
MAATLDDLIAGLPQSMSNQILTPEQQRAQVEQQVGAAMPENLRQYGQLAQQQNEAAFGKGMGLSTWNAYQQALNSMNQTEAAGQIRQNAENAMRQAQQAAIGNAASYATSERNRATQANLAASQNASADARQRAQLAAAGKGQTQGQIFSGLGGLAGGVGRYALSKEGFGPELKGAAQSGYNKLAGLFGGPKTEQAPDMAKTNEMSSEMAPASGGYNAPSSFEASYPSGLNFSGGGTDLPAYGGGYSFDTPSYDYSGLGSSVDNSGMDLWGLLNQQNSGPDYGYF